MGDVTKYSERARFFGCCEEQGRGPTSKLDVCSINPIMTKLSQVQYSRNKARHSILEVDTSEAKCLVVPTCYGLLVQTT
jgi:hypothetical protein